MEKEPLHNPEDMKTAFPVFTEEKDEEFDNDVVPGKPKYSNEIIKHRDEYLPEAITASYDRTLVSLHAKLLEIEKYITAKDIEPALSAEISQLMMARPVSGITLVEKMTALQKYQQIIEYFEKKHAPEQMLQSARKTAADLKGILYNLQPISTTAKENPSLN